MARNNKIKIKIKILISLMTMMAAMQTGSAYTVKVHSLNTNRASLIYERSLVAEGLDPATTTVGDVKRLIEEKFGIQFKDQRLIYRAELLKDDNKLVSRLMRCHACDKDSSSFLVTELIKPDQIAVIRYATAEDEADLSVSGADTLRGLRERGAIGGGRVFLDNVELLEEDKTLADYQVYRGAMMRLFRDDDLFKVRIFPRNQDRPLIYDYDSKVRVKDLKVQLQTDRDYPIEKQKLTSDSKEMLDETKLIDYLPIPTLPLTIDLKLI